jgi:diaminopimelate decarboxylase
MAIDAWWITQELRADDGPLRLDGVDLDALARAHGTPTFVYSLSRIRRRLRILHDLLSDRGLTPKLRYAIKANRHPRVLAAAKSVGAGLDICSPRELERALAAGFRPEDIAMTVSYTSDADLRAIVERGVTPTLDARSGLRRYAKIAGRGAEVGLRLDPGSIPGWGDDPKLSYGASKFGVVPGDLDDVLGVARDAGLKVVGLHVHPGWGMQAHAETAFRAGLQRLRDAAAKVPDLRWVDVGGGLGGRYRASDAPLDPTKWADAVAEIVGPLGVPVLCEPGTFVVAQAGVLLVEINTVEIRGGRRYIGVNAGHALNPCPALYGIPIEVVPTARPLAEPVGVAQIVGHINEATDVWAKDRPFADVAEGDFAALLPAGAYAASMSSDHCLRGVFSEVCVDDGAIVRG